MSKSFWDGFIDHWMVGSFLLAGTLLSLFIFINIFIEHTIACLFLIGFLVITFIATFVYHLFSDAHRSEKDK